MTTKLEIERKFLVRSIPAKLAEFPHASIAQGYLADVPNLVRLRCIDDNVFFLTVKHGPAMMHEECEIPISREQFDALWPFTAGRRLCKTRYEIPYGGHVIELDVFSGVHDGVIVAEVEFPSEAAFHAFEPPGWFGTEVTGDLRYINRRMAVE